MTLRRHRLRALSYALAFFRSAGAFVGSPTRSIGESIQREALDVRCLRLPTVSGVRQRPGCRTFLASSARTCSNKFSSRLSRTRLRAKKRAKRGQAQSSVWYEDTLRAADAVEDVEHEPGRESSNSRAPPFGDDLRSQSMNGNLHRPSNKAVSLQGSESPLALNDVPDAVSEDVDDNLVYERSYMRGVEDGQEWADVGAKSVVQMYGLEDTDFDELEREYDATYPSSPVGERWRNGMELPEEGQMQGEGTRLGRDLDDMLMERSIRFYDPKVTGEREKAYLVGLDASGRGGSSKKAIERAYAESRAELGAEDDSDDGDGWNEEKELAFQEEQRLAYETRKEDREMRFTLEESMAELSELAGTAGLEVAGSTYQRVVEPNPRTYIGTGKVKEIKSAMNQLGTCTVIFDEELSPGQQRSLEVEFGGEAAGIKVLDRTALILDIFAQHARTREGQLQVELALNLYRLPRLTKMWTHLERQQGGVGLRGPGERQLEVDRRLLKDKIIALKKELKDVSRHRDLQRRSRKRLGLPVIALVGYTNAGKSTLLNSLTRAGVMAENMLFATLDPTTRKVKLQGLKVHPEVMLTDTVGFIQKLPTNLVAAFRATLEEVVEADVIIHVVDVSCPSRKKQEKSVVGVLDDMGVLGKPRVTMWNKLDLLPEEEQAVVQMGAAEREQLTVAASAKTGVGMDAFVDVLEEAICELLLEVEAIVPYERGDLMNKIHELGACESEQFTEAGTLIKARVPLELLNRLEPYYVPEFREALATRDRYVNGLKSTTSRGLEHDDVDWALIAKKRHKTRTHR